MNIPAELWKNHFPKGEKILVTGASGWFGISAMNLLLQTDAQIMPISSDGRRIDFKGVEFDTFRWDPKLIQAFKPTTIFDFAFLTREKLSQIPETAFIETNNEIIKRAFWAFRLPSVSRIIGISSGAALSRGIEKKSDTKDPYANLKAEYEERFLELQGELGFTGRLVRAWSVSGRYCRKPESFAFSNFIEQARSGKIEIQSNRRVFRRYVSIDDLLSVALFTESIDPEVLDGGGELLELGDLAKKIVNHVNPEAKIQRNLDSSLEPDCYYSDNQSWEAALALSNFNQTSIENQIKNYS